MAPTSRGPTTEPFDSVAHRWILGLMTVGGVVITIAGCLVWSVIVDPDTRAAPDLGLPELVVLSAIYGAVVGAFVGAWLGMIVALARVAASRLVPSWSPAVRDASVLAGLTALLFLIAISQLGHGQGGSAWCDVSCGEYAAMTNRRDLTFGLGSVIVVMLWTTGVVVAVNRRTRPRHVPERVSTAVDGEPVAPTL